MCTVVNVAVNVPGIPNDVNTISYATNTRIDGDYLIPGHVDNQKSGAINSPSQKVLYCETSGSDGDFLSNSGYWVTEPNGAATDATVQEGFARHVDQMNVIFLDGHAKSMKPTALMSPINMFGNLPGTSVAVGGADCDNNAAPDPNCDQVDPGALADLAALEANNR